MFQFTFSIDNGYIAWFLAIEEIFKNKIKECNGVTAYSQNKSRTNVTIACESYNKQKVLKALKNCFIEMYAVAVKLDYVRNNLNICCLDDERYNILLHTLVAFDRESEREYIERNLIVKDKMTLDGVFNFLLCDLKRRWEETCRLTSQNAIYIKDDNTYNELLKFLISAVNPKIVKLILYENGGLYNLVSDDKGGFYAEIRDGQQLMYYLIDIAPLELVISGRLNDLALTERLVNMFDAKITGKKR